MKKRIWSAFLGIVMVVALLPISAVPVAAADYSYVNEDNIVQSAENCTVITQEMNRSLSGWYIVESDVTISNRLDVVGTVNLILADGATLTAKSGIHLPQGKTLKIYGQAQGTGVLVSGAGEKLYASIGGNYQYQNTDKVGEDCGELYIYGGNITATGNSGGAGIGGGGSEIKDTKVTDGKQGYPGGNGGNVYVYGGTLTATGGWGAAGIGGGRGCDGNKGAAIQNGGKGGDGGNGGNLYVYGGSVTAAGGEYAADIGGGKGGNGGDGGRYTYDVWQGKQGPGSGGNGGKGGAGGSVTISGTTATLKGENGGGKGGAGGAVGQDMAGTSFSWARPGTNGSVGQSPVIFLADGAVAPEGSAEDAMIVDMKNDGNGVLSAIYDAALSTVTFIPKPNKNYMFDRYESDTLTIEEHQTTFAAGKHTVTAKFANKPHVHDEIEYTKLTKEMLDSGSLSSGCYYLGESLQASLSLTISKDTDVTICLNGETLDMGSYNITNNGTLTICDCDEGGKILSARSGIVGVVTNSGNFTLKGGTLEQTRVYGLVNTGTAVISGGKVQGQAYGISNRGSGNLTITGGTVVGGSRSYAIHCANTSTTTISGGTVQGNYYGIYVKDTAELMVTGGTVIGAPSGSTNDYGIYHIGTGTVSVSDGEVKGNQYGIYLAETGTVNISGGKVNGGTCGLWSNNAGTIQVSGGEIYGGSETSTTICGGIRNYQTGTIYLSGTPKISGLHAAIIGNNFVSGNETGAIYAENIDGTAQYTGDTLSVRIEMPSLNQVVIQKVTDSNQDKFTLQYDKGYVLRRNGENLILGLPHSHDWSTVWSSDGDYHWHECAAQNCGVNDNSQKYGYGAHISTDDNVATYTKKANCDRCGKEYGDVVPDTNNPAGEIKIGENGWMKFWNTVTFGLFYKDYVEIEITGTDAETGVKSIEYYISDTNRSDTAIGDVTDWKSYTEKVRIDAERKVYVYARITDHADNVTYLSVDGGVVVFEDTEITTGEYEYILTTKADIVTNLKPGKNTVKEIDLCEPNGNAGDFIGYTINTDGYVVLDGEDIESVTKNFYAGAYTVTVTYHAYGEEYVEGTSKGDKITDTVLTLNVKRYQVEKPAADDTVYVYDGTEKTYNIPASEYYTVSGNKETNSGEFTVTVALKDKNIYEWADGKMDDLEYQFNIGKAAFAANVEQDGSYTYNGEEQTVAVKTSENGVEGGMTVTYKYGLTESACDSAAVPRFKNADTYTVYFVASAENHNDVKGSFAVKIDKKDLTVTANKHAVTYGDEPSHNDVSYDGFVLSETPVVLGGTLGFDYSYQRGDDIGSNYTITPKGLTSDNYNIIFKNGTLTVAPLLIDFDWEVLSPEDLVYDGNDKEIGTTVYNRVTSGQYDIWLLLEYYGDTKNVTDEGFYAKIKGPAGEKAHNYDVDTSAQSPVYKITKATPETNFPTEFHIDADKKLSDIDLTGFDGYTWDAPDTAVKYGVHEYSMTFTPADTANYITVSKIIKVTGGDITAPIGEITLKDHKWNEFLNNITFDLFFKETQSVTITAADTESGIKEIAYYLATEELSKDDIKVLENSKWTVYSDTFAVEPNNKYVVYARITDNAGNITYINSDGVVLDNIVPAISGIENGKDVYGDATFTVDEENLDTVTVDGNHVDLVDGKYTIAADNKEHTVVVTDLSGNSTEYKLTVYKTYTVTFVADGKEIAAQVVGHGKDAELPEIPAKDGYTAKWNADGKNITADTTITAEYTEIPKTDSPQTGDNAQLWLWFGLILASGFTLAGAQASIIYKEESRRIK